MESVVSFTPWSYYPSGMNPTNRTLAGSGCRGGGRYLLFLREMSAVLKTVQYVRDVIDDKYWHVLVFELDVVGCLFSCGDAYNILNVGMT
jgi:hypothetical protein